jgi:hypothetical protein
MHGTSIRLHVVRARWRLRDSCSLTCCGKHPDIGPAHLRPVTSTADAFVDGAPHIFIKKRQRKEIVIRWPTTTFTGPRRGTYVQRATPDRDTTLHSEPEEPRHASRASRRCTHATACCAGAGGYICPNGTDRPFGPKPDTILTRYQPDPTRYPPCPGRAGPTAGPCMAAPSTRRAWHGPARLNGRHGVGPLTKNAAASPQNLFDRSPAQSALHTSAVTPQRRYPNYRCTFGPGLMGRPEARKKNTGPGTARPEII